MLQHFASNPPDPASFPALAIRVVDLLEKPDTKLEDLARWVAMDPAIAGQVLKVANSVIYRRGRDVEELPAAIVRLGLREVGQIAVGVAGRSLFDLEVRAEIAAFRERLAALFLEAMAVAYSAGWLSAKLRVGSPERAFLAGMLHDIGRPIALQSLARLIIGGEIGRPPDGGDRLPPSTRYMCRWAATSARSGACRPTCSPPAPTTTTPTYPWSRATRSCTW